MSTFQTVLFLAFCVASGAFSGNCFAQYVNPATAEDYEHMHDYMRAGSLPWSEVVTNDFNHNGEGELIEHIRNHPMLGDELHKLHEWLHQKVERLRPANVHAMIVVEADEAQFNAWPDRVAIEKAGWTVIRQPVRSGIRNVVAIGKIHFSHAGYLTNAALQRFVNQVENRKVKPLKNARARWVTKITMHTRSNCSWCDKWKATEYSQALADGVAVEFVVDANGTVPRFDVCDDKGQCRQYVGFKAYQEMKRDFQ